MNAYDNVQFDAAVRVDDFGVAHAADFLPESLATRKFAIVHAGVLEFRQQAASQASGLNAALEGTASKNAARENLLDEMEFLSRTSRAMAPDHPGLDDKFRMPRSRGDLPIKSAASAFLSDARPLEKEFLDHEMPKTFLADLQKAIDDFDAADHHQDAGKGTHVAARAGLDRTLDEVFAAIRCLDAIVRNRYRNQPEIVAVWRSARHVERLPRASAEAPSQAAAPAPVERSATGT